MPIHKRGNKYQASFNFKGERHRKSFATHDEAEIWIVTERQSLNKRDLEGELNPKGKGVTLGALRNEVIRYHWNYTKSKKTAELNSATVCKSFGYDTEISSITMGDIEDQIIVWKESGKADATINRLLSAMSKMLKYAVDKDYLTKAPKVRRLKEVNGRIRYLTDLEEKKLLAFFQFIEADLVHDICVVAMDTGMRQGEILAMQVRDVTLGKDASVTIWENKSDHPRTIPLTTRSAAILKVHMIGKKDSGLMFPITRDSVRHYWDRARNQLGFGEDNQFVFHMLRHTFCSRLAQRNVSIGAIQVLAGHKTITMTQRYAHLSAGSLQTAIDVLNQ